MTDETDAGVDAVQLGRAIAATRAERGMKRGHLAEAARVSYPYLSELENGTKRGSTQKLAQIAEALGLSSSQLMARAEALARGGTGVPLPQYSTTPPSATGWSSPTGWPGLAGSAPPAVVRGDDTNSPGPSLRPLGGLSERTEDMIVDRVSRAVRDEIERWLDAELPIAIREQVRAALAKESQTS